MDISPSEQQRAGRVQGEGTLSYFSGKKDKEKMKTRCVSLRMANTSLSILTVLLTSTLIETTSLSPLPCLVEVAALSIASL